MTRKGDIVRTTMFNHSDRTYRTIVFIVEGIDDDGCLSGTVFEDSSNPEAIPWAIGSVLEEDAKVVTENYLIDKYPFVWHLLERDPSIDGHEFIEKAGILLDELCIVAKADKEESLKGFLRGDLEWKRDNIEISLSNPLPRVIDFHGKKYQTEYLIKVWEDYTGKRVLKQNTIEPIVKKKHGEDFIFLKVEVMERDGSPLLIDGGDHWYAIAPCYEKETE